MTEFPTPAAVNAAFAARDRALLYTRGMGVEPVQSVALVLESLSRAGNGAPPSVVMEELFRIVGERQAELLPGDTGDAPLTSMPPINRTPVLPRDVNPLSLSGAVTAALAAFWRRLARKTTQKPGDGA